MGLGTTALSTNQKREPQAQPGPPFDPSSADNGLSVDGVSGKIVLGNDYQDPAAPAQLLSTREIRTDDGVDQYGIILTSFPGAGGAETYMDGAQITVQGEQFAQVSANVGSIDADAAVNVNSLRSNAILRAISSSGGQSLMFLNSLPDQFFIRTNGTGFVDFGVQGNIIMWHININTFTTQIGPTIVADNGARLQVTGTLTRRLKVLSLNANYNFDRDLDSDIQIINTADTTIQLPDMTGSNNREGLIFRCCVKFASVTGIVVAASGGQVIRLGNISSSAGGTVSSTNVGAYLKLIWDNNDWVAESFTGAWIFT